MAFGTYDAMTVEAIRALKDKIEMLENENKTLKTEVGKIHQLETMISELKGQVNEITSHE